MNDAPELWDGRWVVCRAPTLARTLTDPGPRAPAPGADGRNGEDEGDGPTPGRTTPTRPARGPADPASHPAIVGLEHLPAAARPPVVALVGDLTRAIDAQVALPLPAGGHALLTVRGEPAHVEVLVRGAGERPDPFPGEAVVAVLADGRRAELTGVAACVVDPDGTVASVSPALAELAGAPARRLVAAGVAAIVAEEDRGRVLAVARGSATTADGVRVVPRDGGPERWVNVHGVDLQPDPASIADPAPTGHGRLLLVTELHAGAGDLARAAHRASTAFQQASTGRARVSADGTIIAANPTLGRLIDTDPADLVGRSFVDLVADDDRPPLETLLGAALRGDLGGFEHEVRMAPRSADDGPLWARVQVHAVASAGRDPEVDVELHDITSRRRAEAEDRDAVDALRSAFIHGPTPMAVIEMDGTIREANAELRALVGLGSLDGERVRLADLAPADDHGLLDGVLAEIALGGRARVECRLRRHDGSNGVVELSVSTVTGVGHANPFAILQVTDITARRDTEEKLLHQTLHDPLTGLGNRLLLRDRLDRAIAHRHESPFALLFIDLDHFKWTNDTHGHDAGDALLVEVGRRLRAVVRGDDTVARLGGDEFVILASGVTEVMGAEILATKVRASVAQPFAVDDSVLTVTCSVGVVLAGAEHANADALLRDADLLMYQAKSKGRDRHEVTVPGVAGAQPPPVAEALRLALDTDGLRLHHQPIVDLRTGRAVGTEVLLRVVDPVAGARPPGRLLDGVADAELLVELAGWVLDDALDQMAGWDEAGIGPLGVWLNLSGAELGSDNLLERISEALTRARVDASRIHLEIPEPALLMIDGDGLSRLRTLAALGIRLGIDDFGTGSTSLTHLRSLPVHFLKIDPSIGRRLREPGGRAVVEAVVAVGRALGLEVIAEGIEERSQLETLALLGCTHAQGNLFAEPAPAETLALPGHALDPDHPTP